MTKELIAKEIIMFDVEASTKEEIINIIAEAMMKDCRVNNKNGYIEDIIKRERVSSTAVGFLIATPHAKSVYVNEPSLAFIKLKNPIKWDDEEMVQIVFQIGVPSPGQGERHLEILSTLFRRIVKKDFRDKLSKVETADDVIALVGNV